MNWRRNDLTTFKIVMELIGIGPSVNKGDAHGRAGR